MAEEHFLKAKDILLPHFQPFTNLFMNMGNIEAQKKEFQKAIDNYEVVISQSPHANPKAFAGEEVLFSKHINSFNAYVDAHTNAAVMYVQLDQFQKGFEYCEKSL
jgi:tetratricopeptide (TPR) repeat protein